MSTPATDLPATVINNVFELPGQSALSAFRLQKLVDDLRVIDPRVERLNARFSYFLSVSEDLPNVELEQLDALLLSGEPVLTFPSSAQLIYTAPRPGTISPWSSKATDIAQACHLDRVLRIERSTCYAVDCTEPLSTDELQTIGAALFD